MTCDVQRLLGRRLELRNERHRVRPRCGHGPTCRAAGPFTRRAPVRRPCSTRARPPRRIRPPATPAESVRCPRRGRSWSEPRSSRCPRSKGWSTRDRHRPHSRPRAHRRRALPPALPSPRRPPINGRTDRTYIRPEIGWHHKHLDGPRSGRPGDREVRVLPIALKSGPIEDLRKFRPPATQGPGTRADTGCGGCSKWSSPDGGCSRAA